MKGYIEVAIPVKPYIKAFIIKELGEEKIKLHRSRNFIHHKLYDLLQHEMNNKKSEAPCNYGAKINMFISIDTFKRRGHHLNHSNIKSFNRFIEKIIKHRMYTLLDDFIDVMPSIEAHLPEVRKRLGIDVEAWSDDSIRKDYYRYRLSKNKPTLYESFGRTVPSEKADGIAF